MRTIYCLIPAAIVTLLSVIVVDAEHSEEVEGIEQLEKFAEEHADERTAAIHILDSMGCGIASVRFRTGPAPEDYVELPSGREHFPIRAISVATTETEFGSEPDGPAVNFSDNTLIETLPLFPELERLELWSTLVTDKCVETIIQMPNLKSLTIAHTHPLLRPCGITDEGFQLLARCESLEELRFVGVAMGDESVRQLATLPHLRKLHIEGTFVTPECLRYIVQSTSIQSIVLYGNQGVMGTLFAEDIPEYDQLSHPLSDEAAECMVKASGEKRSIRIENTAALHETTVSALCRTPTVSRIRIRLRDVRRTPSDERPPQLGPEVLLLLDGQEHLEYLDLEETMRPSNEVIHLLGSVNNNSVRLRALLDVDRPGVGEQALSISEWRQWAQMQIED